VRALKGNEQSKTSHYMVSVQTEVLQLVSVRDLFCESSLHDVDLAGKCNFRQGLQIEDLQTPLGQECSNGSLILFAVVLWRTFFARAANTGRAGPFGYEAPQS
jgi:hypothetical protein